VFIISFDIFLVRFDCGGGCWVIDGFCDLRNLSIKVSDSVFKCSNCCGSFCRKFFDSGGKILSFFVTFLDFFGKILDCYGSL